MKDANKTREIAVYGALASFTAVFILFPIKYPTPWGIDIDLIAITWLIAFFLYGIRGGTIVSIIGAILIMLFSGAGWVGALTKFLATYSMIVGLFATQKTLKFKLNDFGKIRNIVIASMVGLLLRAAIIIPFNYFFALKIWLPGMSTQELMETIPWFIIFGLNIIQGSIDIIFAWIIVFKAKLKDRIN